MSNPLFEKLGRLLDRIDRPGSFCFSASAPAVLPGLEVKGLGPVGLPLTAKQAKELKQLCEQAPYGKGEKTVVDTSVRKVWRLKPERFALTNPDWKQFLQQTLDKVQEELGLEQQKLQAHLYDLLLYEPGGFFLPHRDGEKLKRMVATLVVVLPSSYEGGELVVRHEGQEQTIDFGGGEINKYRVHVAAFYADCEHEIRPLRKGYRLCLVYNLTLKKGNKSVAAPRSLDYVERISEVLREWAQDEAHRMVAITLEHQYTQEGLTWDALKGVDRARARVLQESARRADCQANLALLTFHQSGSAEGDYDYGYYGRRGSWGYYDEEEDDPSAYEMGEVFETSLTAEHWRDGEGKPLPLGAVDVDEDEILDPDALEGVEPEEEFEGYTGNEGMTLDRWYRHGAIFIWPNKRHFYVLCSGGGQNAVAALKQLVAKWRKAGKADKEGLKQQCVDFAATIVARWRENPYGSRDEATETGGLLRALLALDEPRLIKGYLGEVMLKDASVDPGKAVAAVAQKYGWETFRPELEAVVKATTTETLRRTVRLLEAVCLAKPRKKAGWAELCRALAEGMVAALEALDRERDVYDWRLTPASRAVVLAGLARALIATEQDALLSRVVAHALAMPKKYPLTEAHVAALTALGPWLKKNVKRPCPPVSEWLAACCGELEALTAEVPQPPADFRRPAKIPEHCADCGELKKFLNDRKEEVHHFRMAEQRRRHLEERIRSAGCDLDCKTERHGSPYALVCTKNTASYEASLKKYHQDKEHLAELRAIQAGLAQ
jgi:hypothetical protein